MLSSYIDTPTFQRMATGYVQPSAVATALTSAVSSGATTLPVASTSGLTVNQQLYVQDGPNTEMVVLTAISGLSLTVSPALAANHANGTFVSTGIVPATLLSASAWLDAYCQQGTPTNRTLWQQTRTSVIPLPSMQANWDTDRNLRVIFPAWPVSAISSLTISQRGDVQLTAGTSSLVFLDDDRSIQLPAQAFTANSGWYDNNVLPLWARGTPSLVNVSYTAGYAQTDLPVTLQLATVLIAQELLAYAQNPTGAALLRQGDVQIEQRLRGSGNQQSSTDGIYISQAKALLLPLKRMW